MIPRSHLRALCLPLLAALAFAARAPQASLGAFLQEEAFQPGERVEYRASKFPEKWEAGVVLKILPGGVQLLIREKPTEFFPEGFERAYYFSEVRRIAARPIKPPSASNEQPANADRPTGLGSAPGGAPMTQAEVLQFLRTRLGDNPFQHPDLERIRKELGETINRRGVNFRYDVPSDFANELAKFGATSEITFPIDANFGPPTQRSRLMGTWSMDIIGVTVDFVREGWVVRQGEIGAKGEVLTITADGAYAWRGYATDAPAETLKGTWRKATPEEMKYQGGEGIVLLAAKSGWDWIVTGDRSAPTGDWIRVAELTTRQVREFGSRQGNGKKGATPRAIAR